MNIRAFVTILSLAFLNVPQAFALQSHSSPAPFLRSLSLNLGTPVQGVTLSGPLAGKTAFVLPPSINIPNCWIDSAVWTGNEIVYTLSSFSYTRLVSPATGYVSDPACKLPSGQPASSFYLYAAAPRNSAWRITRLATNTAQQPYQTAPTLSWKRMAYISAEPSKAYLGNIYFIEPTTHNQWSNPIPFPYNSVACKDDNPHLYQDGATLIFESNRADPMATSCIPDHQKLWISKLSGKTWSKPELLTGAPALGNQSFQPWVNETGQNIFWTADHTMCGDGAMNCVVTTKAKNETPQQQGKEPTSIAGKNWADSFVKMIAPSPLVPGQTNGKVVLVGEYSQAGNMAFFVCGIATETDPKGKTATLFNGRWSIAMNICAIPLN